MAKNYKTIALTGAEQKVVLAGQNCDIRNDSVDIVYASAEAGITSGADGVLSIPAGQAAKLLDCRGTLYILGTGSVMLCGNDYSELVFKTAATSSGEGGGTVDEVARQAISSHANNEDIHLTAEKAIEAAATTISNPNLLIDPDFKINQRGRTEYSEGGYIIDQWYKNTGGVISVAESGAIMSGDALIRQTIENFAAYYNRTLTVSCEYDGEVRIGTFVMPETGGLAVYQDDDILISIYQDFNGRDWLVFTPQDIANPHTLSWTKLELGSMATPFIPPDPATELAKCQRYYQICTTGDIDPVDLRPSMRITPTVTQLDDSNYEYNAEL